jgi:hypothetical protein
MTHIGWDRTPARRGGRWVRRADPEPAAGAGAHRCRCAGHRGAALRRHAGPRQGAPRVRPARLRARDLAVPAAVVPVRRRLSMAAGSEIPAPRRRQSPVLQLPLPLSQQARTQLRPDRSRQARRTRRCPTPRGEAQPGEGLGGVGDNGRPMEGMRPHRQASAVGVPESARVRQSPSQARKAVVPSRAEHRVLRLSARRRRVLRTLRATGAGRRDPP